MAETPPVFLGVMVEGSQTPDDQITEMLCDRYARDWMEREISFEQQAIIQF